MAKSVATLDRLSGGRVRIGADFGWNTDELAAHGIPAGRRRVVLREHVEAMRALWTREEASYDGEFVNFGACWAYPKPLRDHIPLVIGAGVGPKTFTWIAANADGWMTTPAERNVPGNAQKLRGAWRAAGRRGAPEIHVLAMTEPTPDVLAEWEKAGVTEAMWGLPDASPEEVEAFLERHAGRLGIS